MVDSNPNGYSEYKSPTFIKQQTTTTRDNDFATTRRELNS
jgi:hypothetical protein